MTRDEVLDELWARLGQLSEQLAGEVHDPELEVDPCAALNLFVTLLGHNGDWRRTLLESPPCAYESAKVLAEVNGRVNATAFADWRCGLDLIVRHREMAGKDRPVRILFLEGKPNDA